MGFGDAARFAAKKAVEAFEATIVLGEKVNNLLSTFQAMEGRMRADQQDFEKRLREMESRVAKLEGRVEAALGEAYRVLLAERSEQALRRIEPTPNDPDSTGLPKKPPALT